MGKKSTSVQSDPAVGAAAERQAAVAERAQTLAEQSYNDNKSLYESMGSAFTDLMNQSVEASKTDMERSADQWDTYQQYFQPAQEQYAQNAMGYNTQARRDEAAASGRADVQSAYDTARAEQTRDLGRAGISLSSGRALTLDNASRLQQARDSAAASTNARNYVEQTANNMLGNVANMANGVSTTALGTQQAGLAAGNNALGTATTQQGMLNSGYSAASGLLGTATSANSSAGNLGLGLTQAQLSAANANAGSLGSLLGGVGMLAGTIYASSKKLKTKRGNVSGKKAASLADVYGPEGQTAAETPQTALAHINNLDVDTWKYKPGVADEGVHVGPYAEDVQREFGDGTAPGGNVINMQAMQAHNALAIRGLESQVAELEAELAGAQEVQQ